VLVLVQRYCRVESLGVCTKMKFVKKSSQLPTAEKMRMVATMGWTAGG